MRSQSNLKVHSTINKFWQEQLIDTLLEGETLLKLLWEMVSANEIIYICNNQTIKLTQHKRKLVLS